MLGFALSRLIAYRPLLRQYQDRTLVGEIKKNRASIVKIIKCFILTTFIILTASVEIKAEASDIEYPEIDLYRSYFKKNPQSLINFSWNINDKITICTCIDNNNEKKISWSGFQFYNNSWFDIKNCYNEAIANRLFDNILYEKNESYPYFLFPKRKSVKTGKSSRDSKPTILLFIFIASFPLILLIFIAFNLNIAYHQRFVLKRNEIIK